MSKIIKLNSKGYQTIVDDEDYDFLSSFKWYKLAREDVYARCVFGFNADGTRRMVLLHRLVMDVVDNPDVVVDHINHNTLDNRKENLRICTIQQNSFNKRCRGYSFHKAIGKWAVNIRFDGFKFFCGYYNNEEEAKHISKAIRQELFGEYACVDWQPKKELEIIW